MFTNVEGSGAANFTNKSSNHNAKKEKSSSPTPNKNNHIPSWVLVGGERGEGGREENRIE